MRIIDAQVHVWYSDRPSRPWSPAYRAVNRERLSYLQHAGQTNSPLMAIEEMAEAGVDAALLTSLGIYGDSLDVELDAVERWPDRFRAIGVTDPTAPDIVERLAELKRRGLLGIRIPELRTAERVRGGDYAAVLQACNDLGLTVMLPAVNDALGDLFDRYPKAFFYLNHLGLGWAPPIVTAGNVEPFSTLPQVCALARHPNVGLKLTGLPAMSRELFPFKDIWWVVRQVVSAFGAERIAWGSDYTRTAGLLSYWDGVHYLREIDGLSGSELALLYGEALAQRTGWDLFSKG